MATLKELNIKLDADAKGLQAKMKKAANDLRREARNFGQIGTELSLAVSLPLLGIGASALRAAGDMESFKMGFQTTMKAAGRSAQEATKEMEALREVAKLPGIDFEQALKGSMRLQGVGMNAEKAREIIAQLANGISMAGGTAQDLDGVTRQLAQMAGKGKVMQQDLNIMLENMPMLAKVLKDTFGATTADGLRDMGVNAEQFIDGITRGLSKLERVPGGLANSMVNFGVEVKMALATVGEAINKSFNVTGKLEDFAGWISDTAAGFANLSEGTQKVIITTLGVVAAIGPAAKAFSILNNTKAAAIDIGNKLVGAYRSLGGMIVDVAAKWQAMDKVTKATTIGLIVAAIAAAVLVFQHYNSELSLAEKNTKNLADVQMSAQQSIAAERMEAERLISVIKDENASRKDKAAALERLNQLGGEYFKGLSIEKKDIGELTKAYDAYVANLLKAATIKASEGKLLDLEKKRLEVLQSITNNEKQAALNKGKAMSGAFGAAPRILELKRELADIEAQQKALADIAYKSAPGASAGGGSTSTFTPSGGDGSGKKKKGKADKAPADAMADLSKAMATADAKATALGSTFDATQAKTDAVRDAIETLISQGVTPSDERLAMLSERYKNLTADITPLPALFNGVTGAMMMGTTVQDVLIEKTDAISRAFQDMGAVITSAMETAGMAMQETAAQGETSFRKLGKAALKSAADVVRAALMEYVATTIKKAAFLGPLGAILAPAAGAVAGAAFNNILKGLKIPAFAKGTYANKPTLGVFGEAGPEYVLPEKKLHGVMRDMANLPSRNGGGGNMHLSGEFRVQGTDLVLVLEKAMQQQYRSFGRG